MELKKNSCEEKLQITQVSYSFPFKKSTGRREQKNYVHRSLQMKTNRTGKVKAVGSFGREATVIATRITGKGDGTRICGHVEVCNLATCLACATERAVGAGHVACT
jgi:hypothetical protein